MTHEQVATELSFVTSVADSGRDPVKCGEMQEGFDS
jgi:hypothetical protein